MSHYIPERGSTHVYKVKKISKEEIGYMTGLCTYEQPAFCNSACPLKLDTKSMLAAVADGNFKKALQIYEKIAPFPMILSSGCEAPCESQCRICEVGDGIAIRDIEAAVSTFGERTKSSGVFRMEKKKKVAIFGSGLFCLFLAGELEKKMYPLTVFCEEADIEQYLRTETEFLPEEAFKAELERLKSKYISFEFGCIMTPAFFEEKRQEFDVVCASEKLAKLFFPDAICNEKLMVFAPEKLVMGCGEGVMNAAFGAKKAALSVDRLAQNLDPNNTRGDEGAAESKLYTDLGMAKELKRVAKNGAYTKEEAVEEAKRCIQCHCDECMKACPFIVHFQKPPSLLSREIFNNTQIIMGDHQLNKVMNACALCGQCKVICPNGFDMATVCKDARENMVATDKMSLAVHEFALQDMLFSNDEAFVSIPQPGYEKCRYVFFPGCQASAIAPETVKAAYADLCSRLEGGVALMLGCCGAICDWAGRYEMYDETKAFIDSELAKLGNPTIIAGCPSCAKELRAYENAEVKGIWDVINEIGLPDTAKALEKPAAIHDSCGARGDGETQNAIRSIIEKLGMIIIETEYSGDKSPCCGYGGLTAYTNREVAKLLTDKCLERSDAPFVTYCMACRDRFAREGHESRHILELLYGTDAGLPPDISEKRFNRLSLKQELLKELLGVETVNKDLGFKIDYTDEARKMMDDRMILTSDVEYVLQQLRESGETIYDSDCGLCITRSRDGNVTFWVMYEEKEDGYLVHRAYSHRMTIDIREV